MSQKKAIIIGAGPAGLTAAFELLKHTDVKPVIFEMSDEIGGIARTVNYKGNRIDIGGHRFFSKSDRVMQWWFDVMPIQKMSGLEREQLTINYQGKSKELINSQKGEGPDPDKVDKVFLVRNRLSRIYYLARFFNYPLSFTLDTIKNLGIVRLFRFGISYTRAKINPVEEKSLQDFFINRFGKELYLTFFKDYTEKVWGFKCDQISPEWGAQRIKTLDIGKAIWHAVTKPFKKADISQKQTETSLIERFVYPKFGPGQLWEEIAKTVQGQGAELHMNHELHSFIPDSDHSIKAVKVRNTKTGEITEYEGDYFFSTMPIKDLIASFESGVPEDVEAIAKELPYRDFITVGLLLKNFKAGSEQQQREDVKVKGLVPDNWIYIQERDVKVGRLQIFNNWSPYMVSDPSKVWVGLEYFCNEGDEMWSLTDEQMKQKAIDELIHMKMIQASDVEDGVVIRVKKTYPAYHGAYEQFDKIRAFTDKFENLFLVGRNGMHRYNNQDHSMLTAMTAVENIMNGITTKDNIWDVNTEKDYHEEK